MSVEVIAKVCHEANRALCEGLDDFSQKQWDYAPAWQRTSARNGVMFHLDHPDATPSASHESWMKEKLDAGWKYGPVKDETKKEHPCLVPFSDLPVPQQAKDYLFTAIVNSLRPLAMKG